MIVHLHFVGRPGLRALARYEHLHDHSRFRLHGTLHRSFPLEKFCGRGGFCGVRARRPRGQDLLDRGHVILGVRQGLAAQSGVGESACNPLEFGFREFELGNPHSDHHADRVEDLVVFGWSPRGA